MNKKTAFIFAAGIVLGAVAFALASVSFHKSPRSTAFPTFPATQTLSPAFATDPQALQPVETPFFRSLMSQEPDNTSTLYEVKKGDSLSTIAKAHGTTVELIRKINALSSDRLSIGQKLKIPNVVFSVVVDKSQNSLILKGGEEVLKTYVVSTGSDNSTPAGVFKVTDKLVNPTWYKSGAVVPFGSPENVLGSRWIGLTKKGYGIHGTTEPDRLGQQITAGCIRMRNEEVEELFGFVTPHTEVTIVD